MENWFKASPWTMGSKVASVLLLLISGAAKRHNHEFEMPLDRDTEIQAALSINLRKA